MSLNSLNLLRMLEPTVRPVEGGVASPTTLPIEQRSFESLLMDASTAAEVGGDNGTVEPPKVNPLSSLTGLDAIECASLRDLIATRTNQR